MSVELNDAAGTVRVKFDPSVITSDIIRNHLKQLCQTTELKTEPVEAARNREE